MRDYFNVDTLASQSKLLIHSISNSESVQFLCSAILNRECAAHDMAFPFPKIATL